MKLSVKHDIVSSYQSRLKRVLSFIQDHLDQPLHLQTLADVACFSPYHFHRIFRGMMGEGVKEHVRRLRMEAAAQRLAGTDDQVIHIALDAGYESHEAFSRAFKRQWGCAPSHYRRQGGSDLPHTPSGVHYGRIPAVIGLMQGAGNMKVQIKEMEPMRVVCVRHTGPYDQCGKAWDQLLPILGEQGLLGGDAHMIGLSYDDPHETEPEEIRYDACVKVDENYQPTDGLTIRTVAGGVYATVTHQGPYSKLNETYDALCGQWLPQSGYELRSDPCFEIYLTDPEGTEPEDMLTDIYAPLAPMEVTS